MNEGTVNLLLMLFFFVLLPIFAYHAARGLLRWIGRQLGTRKDK